MSLSGRRGAALWAALVSLAVSGMAGAAPGEGPRITVAPLEGSAGAACGRRLAQALSAGGEITPWALPVRPGPFRTHEELAQWLARNARRLGAEVVILGSALSKEVVLEAYDAERGVLLGLQRLPAATRSGCKLSRGTQGQLLRWQEQLVAAAKARRGGAAVAVVPPQPAPGPEVEVPAEAARSAEDDDDEPLAAAEARIAPPEPAVEVDLPSEPIHVALEAELGLVRRGLRWGGPRTPNLRALELGALPLPGLRLEAHLFARRSPLVAPLFVAARYRRGVGATVRRAEGGPEHPLAHAEAAASLGYRWLAPNGRFVLVPRAGLHVLTAGVGAADGLAEPDFPTVAYRSLLLGLGLELPVVAGAHLVLEGAYLHPLSAGPILGAAFFPGGSARGLEVEAGLRFEVAPGVSVSLAGSYLGYALDFAESAGPSRGAGSAADTITGLRAGLRLTR